MFSGQDSAGQTVYFGMFDGLFQTFSTGFGVYSASVNSTASSFTVTLGDIVTHFSFDPSPDHVAVVIVNSILLLHIIFFLILHHYKILVAR